MKHAIFAAGLMILPSLGHSATLTLYDSIANGYQDYDNVVGLAVDADYMPLTIFDAEQDGTIDSFEVTLSTITGSFGQGYSAVELNLYSGVYFTSPGATLIGTTQITLTSVDQDVPDWINTVLPYQVTAFHGLTFTAGQTYSLSASWIDGDDAIWRTTNNTDPATSETWTQGEVWIPFNQALGLRVLDLEEPLPAVPVPASLPMIAGGLGLLAVLRRRRR